MGIALAAGVLSLYAIVMLWPYLAATLVRGIDRHRLDASRDGADGTILQIVNDRLDPTPVLAAEAALADARLRVAAAAELLEQVQALDQQRRALMKCHAVDYRADLDAEIAVREARVVLLAAKAENAGDIATRTGNVSDRGYRSRDFHDESKIKVAECAGRLDRGTHGPRTRQAATCDRRRRTVPRFRRVEPRRRREMAAGRGRGRTRAAETIGPADLAAIAKGRDKGDAQVLLKLDADARGIRRLPG